MRVDAGAAGVHGSGGPPERPGVVVAVDGPSGSGKSSVCRRVAQQLGLAYLDTGAMYRAATWWCRDLGLDLADGPAVAAAVRGMDLRMGMDPAAPTVHVGATDVAAAIREPAISGAVSHLSTNLEVRAELVDRQRALIAAERHGGAAGGRGVVAEGRDITTVVAPDADVRILLTASEEARLARRALEVHGVADDASIAATRAHVVGRDAKDATVVEFRTAADGVVTLDSSALTFEQTIEAVLALVSGVLARRDRG